ncbi:MAG TPA: nucleoside kinase [Candidatus Coprenecus stercoravium]|uniref:Nucleoside kinase n=1 Tax=Candidatus Coprenecus stercoravium TaxID=2840735 RepID=A0A9D2GNJ3_9BACT|nr:nucleoside kinase [Candidatus Coprenecus stercoravium]
MITIYCDSLNGFYDCTPGMTVGELSRKIDTGCKYPVVAALVDNMLKELSFKIYAPHTIKFIDCTHSDGRRTYSRSLSFVLQKAAVDLYPEYSLFLDYTLPNGLYGELRKKTEDGNYVTEPAGADKAGALRKRMTELIEADLPFEKTKMPNNEAVALFRKNGRSEKASLVADMEKFFVSVYWLDGYPDTFYGPLLERTGDISVFDLIPYGEGFCLQAPSAGDPTVISPYKYQDKLSSVFKENADWCSILGAHGIGSVNEAIRNGEARNLIALAESLHERKYVKIADMIYERRDKVKLVLIAGPSSSGKTTTSKRIALQCKVLGMRPLVIAMDDYFLNRDKTPKDANGEYDFESIYALDLPFLGTQLNDLFDGKEVDMPKYDFVKGERHFDGRKMRMKEGDILIMEGIHALNPELTKHIDGEKVFRVFASALTSLSVDENNYISTADNRLLRRIVRDNFTRGITPEDTILRWKSVRSGEERNIFPFQENADVMFNSALLFELPLLRYYAEPLLERIPPLSEAYAESVRLLKFLSYITPLTPDETDSVPPTSVMREFIGGSTFEY